MAFNIYLTAYSSADRKKLTTNPTNPRNPTGLAFFQKLRLFTPPKTSIAIISGTGKATD